MKISPAYKCDQCGRVSEDTSSAATPPRDDETQYHCESCNQDFCDECRDGEWTCPECGEEDE